MIHCNFFKTVFSRERVKPWFFVTFDIIIKHIFPENLIEISQVVWKIRRFSSSILTIFIIFGGFFYLQTALNRLLSNCIKLYWCWISSSWYMKQWFLTPRKFSFKPLSFPLALSNLRQLSATESSLKIMKNAFYFTLSL